MIRYHGTPITPSAAAVTTLIGRHGLVSYANPEQIGLVAESCQSFVLDNGAFTHWKQGTEPDWDGFTHWANEWVLHPGFDWLVIPDVIDGDELENKKLVKWFMDRFPRHQAVPVWHLHESIAYLKWLISEFPRIAFGSSGEFSTPKTDKWETRMNEAFSVLCDDKGRPIRKNHGLRMMDPTIFSRYPFASVDSSNVARNMGIDKQWETNPYMSSVPKNTRAMFMAMRCESHASASVWVPSREKQYRLLLG